MPSVQEGLQWRLEQSRRDDFVDRMLAEIDSRRVRVLRVHSAGDFYRTEYARKWLQIARARPKVRFTFWTRTWRVAKFRPVLAALARRRNVTAYWSLDRDTAVPRRVPKRVRLAYVQADPADRPPPGLALVFRAKAVRLARPAQRVNGGPVCPPEQGRAATAGVTCETCRYCFPAASEPTKPGRFGLPMAVGR